jgi:hypothetical protein
MKTAAFAVLAASALTFAASADELYRQNPIDVAGGFSSQDARNPGGLGWFSEVSDNFHLNAASTVNRIQFWGGYAQVTPGNTTGFMIRIYDGSDGIPGTLISTQDITTFTEVSDFVWFNGAHRYLTTVDISPVNLPAGDFWLSVVAILPRGGTAQEPQWGWVQAPFITPPMARQTFFGSQLITNADVAFVVHGTANTGGGCGTADFNCDGDFGTDQDIEAFFACLAGSCPNAPCSSSADFNGDGDVGTDQDIEAFFRVLAGGTC